LKSIPATHEGAVVRLGFDGFTKHQTCQDCELGIEAPAIITTADEKITGNLEKGKGSVRRPATFGRKPWTPRNHQGVAARPSITPGTAEPSGLLVRVIVYAHCAHAQL
jgi:hypothetical protein